MSEQLDALAAAKEQWQEQRVITKRKMQELYIEEMQDAELGVDLAVRAALESGCSRGLISTTLGESRTTVNERLRRAYGGEAIPEITPTRTVERKRGRRKPKAEKPEPLKELKPYLISADHLLVDYHEYGPDGLSGTGTFEIIREEEDDGVYWFLSMGSDEDVSRVLDTVYSGWYYEDALQFVRHELAEETQG